MGSGGPRTATPRATVAGRRHREAGPGAGRRPEPSCRAGSRGRSSLFGQGGERGKGGGESTVVRSQQQRQTGQRSILSTSLARPLCQGRGAERGTVSYGHTGRHRGKRGLYGGGAGDKRAFPNNMMKGGGGSGRAGGMRRGWPAAAGHHFGGGRGGAPCRIGVCSLPVQRVQRRDDAVPNHVMMGWLGHHFCRVAQDVDQVGLPG